MTTLLFIAALALPAIVTGAAVWIYGDSWGAPRDPERPVPMPAAILPGLVNAAMLAAPSRSHACMLGTEIAGAMTHAITTYEAFHETADLEEQFNAPAFGEGEWQA